MNIDRSESWRSGAAEVDLPGHRRRLDRRPLGRLLRRGRTSGQAERLRGECWTIDRPGEQVPLAELAAHLPKAIELPAILDAFGDDPQAERPAERDDGVCEGPVVAATVGGADELASDLEDVDLEPSQVAK